MSYENSETDKIPYGYGMSVYPCSAIIYRALGLPMPIPPRLSTKALTRAERARIERDIERISASIRRHAS
jgi:hypothetical protein